MAVAADSHCDFLIPEEYRRAVSSIPERYPANCDILFVWTDYTTKA